MIKTEEQRRWWFATHPELSWSHRGGGSRGGYGGGNKDSSGVSPKDVDSYVDEALKYETGTTAELLKALKSWFGTEFESKTPEEQHALLWGDDDAAEDKSSGDQEKSEKQEPTFGDAVLKGIDNTLQDWQRWLGLGGALTNPSRTLARNLEKAGRPRPDGHSAHHMIPSQDNRFPEAGEARKMLQKFGIDINDASNGVWLPHKPGVGAGRYHPGLHSREYYAEVSRLLRDATSKEDAVRVLDSIGRRLSKGTFPK